MNPICRRASREIRRADLKILPLPSARTGSPCCREPPPKCVVGVAAVHKAGDHDIILGEVLSGEEIACTPLIFHKGAYGGLSTHLIKVLLKKSPPRGGVSGLEDGII